MTDVIEECEGFYMNLPQLTKNKQQIFLSASVLSILT
jgi:hypothetical protein